jgi:hypothetical protein
MAGQAKAGSHGERFSRRGLFLRFFIFIAILNF